MRLKEIGDAVDRILIICQDVQSVAEEKKTCNFPSTIFSGVEDNLTLVCKIAKKCEKAQVAIASSTFRKN
jgi:hypothetical protein